jgi:hypothetical protein
VPAPLPAGRVVTLPCRVSPKQGSGHDALHLLQAAAPTVAAMDAGAVLARPSTGKMPKLGLYTNPQVLDGSAGRGEVVGTV